MTRTSREADWTTWMRAALAGDTGAYRKFLHAVAPYIRAVARSRCRRLGVLESEAEDIVQEVLLTIHLKQGTWDPVQTDWTLGQCHHSKQASMPSGGGADGSMSPWKT